MRAPFTLGSLLRSFTSGNVRQLDAAGRELLADLARRAPLLSGADVLAFVDIDSMQRRVYGHKKHSLSSSSKPAHVPWGQAGTAGDGFREGRLRLPSGWGWCRKALVPGLGYRVMVMRPAGTRRGGTMRWLRRIRGWS